ncbi:hypothetical protein OVA24_01520 [Luteolibacter sp. SL250]|uniref:hypothetical protein n=1 Tax=Luteolibacter sp. SL250 TaxID=2995170 RepID=UPI002270A71A|nr:hypothetical protein [Luteolibacter sp. SL250]WAC20056.1 hypothetical protein OVA24_01520 [Luteolibacter sp. SL250]
MKPGNRIQGACLAATLTLIGTELSGAATLYLDATEKYDATMATPVNLTANGTQDWAYWASNSGTVMSAPLAPTNRRSGATLISGLTNVNGTGLRGSTTADAHGRYSWTGGTSPATGTNVNLTGGLVFNDLLNSNGSGFSFTVKGDPTQDYYVVLYAGGFAATGALSLSLNGLDDVTSSTLTFANVGPKQVAAYQIVFRPDSADDLLTVRFTASGVNNSASHVGIEAVTVGLLPVIPEPSSALLGGVASLLILRRRKTS